MSGNQRLLYQASMRAQTAKYPHRMSTRLQIIQKTLIRIPTLRLAVLLVSRSLQMGVSDGPRQRNSVEVFLARSTIFLANPR